MELAATMEATVATEVTTSTAIAAESAAATETAVVTGTLGIGWAGIAAMPFVLRGDTPQHKIEANFKLNKFKDLHRRRFIIEGDERNEYFRLKIEYQKEQPEVWDEVDKRFLPEGVTANHRIFSNWMKAAFLLVFQKPKSTTKKPLLVFSFGLPLR